MMINELRLSTQAYSSFISLGQQERLFINDTLLRLKGNPQLGLKLWGTEDIYCYQASTDSKIIYRLAGGEIQVVGIRTAREYPFPPRDKISAIVLAAGKANVPWLSHLTETFLATDIDDLIVVVGYQAEWVKKELRSKDIKVVVNPSYEQGLSKSLRCGLQMVTRATTAVVLALGNRPFIESGVIDKLITAYKKERAPIVVPAYREIGGHPVIFDAALVPELFRVRGNVGGRDVIAHHRQELIQVTVEDTGIFRRTENQLN